MRRDELAHLLRAAATIAGDGDILVVGSQAILGSHSEEELPEEAWISIEADLVFLDRWPPVSRPQWPRLTVRLVDTGNARRTHGGQPRTVARAAG